MNEHNFWTGLADFTIGEMPQNAIGIIARVVTFAKDYDAFLEKVELINSQMEGVLNYVDECSRVSEFLQQSLIEDHEIHEMFEQAKRRPEDVVYGEFHYYTHNDA